MGSMEEDEDMMDQSLEITEDDNNEHGEDQSSEEHEHRSDGNSTEGATIEVAGDKGNNEESALCPLNIIIKTYFNFLTDEKEEAAVRENLRVLGVSSISDLNYIQHGIGIKDAFHDVLNPVQMGKLVLALEKRKSELQTFSKTHIASV